MKLEKKSIYIAAYLGETAFLIFTMILWSVESPLAFYSTAIWSICFFIIVIELITRKSRGKK